MKEQLALHKPQRIPLWAKDSILRSEFGEPDKGDTSQKRYLWWKPMAWLGIIRPTNQSEKWHMQQWCTFFCLTLGLPMPWISLSEPSLRASVRASKQPAQAELELSTGVVVGFCYHKAADLRVRQAAQSLPCLFCIQSCSALLFPPT